MIEIDLNYVYGEIERALGSGDIDKAERYTFPALDQFPDDAQLYFYAAHVLVQRGYYTLAREICEKALQLSPNGRIYGNLGAIFRRLNMNKEAEKALRLSIEYDDTDKNAWNNIAANYINEGNPWPGVDAAKRALELDPTFNKARWNLGLLQLETGDFGNGFDNYREGLAFMDRMLRSYSTGEGDGPKLLESIQELIDYRELRGTKPRVIVWGEQGIGDEIMFSTVLWDLNKYADIVLECHPRLLKMFMDSYPFVKEFYPTRKESHIEWPLDTAPCPFKTPIGDLGKFFRRDLASFQKAAKDHSPWLRADMDAVADLRRGLEELGGEDKHYVGIAWTGGVIRTMRWYRSCRIDDFLLMAMRKDIVFVSLQYEDDTADVAKFIEKTGAKFIRLPSITQHYDYHHTLELVLALDEVVTVCQSVAHLSAAAGQVTRVLVPDKPAWRYGLKGDEWYWYGENAKLYRRKPQNGTHWQPTMEAICEDMDVPSGRRWGMMRGLIEHYKFKTFLEVGPKEGRTAEHVLKRTNAHVTVVDPWEKAQENEAESYEHWDWDAIKDEFHRRTDPYKDRLRVIQDFSLNAAKEETFYDLIFIDAAHDYENVKADIQAWLPRVRPGGVIAGHDYDDQFPGVKQAVDESFEEVHHLSDSVWYARVGPGVKAHEWTLLEGQLHEGLAMLELGSKKNDGYKKWFADYGISHTSVDLNGKGGALQLDLQEPLNIGQFDIVTNFGTTEHVENQEPCWRNIVNSLKVGGTFISTTPCIEEEGWRHHGKWYPTLEWLREFCELNGLEVEICEALPDPLGRYMNCLRAKRIAEKSFQMPNPELMALNESGQKTGAYSYYD